MPLIATRGAASAQGFGEFAQASAPVYIEDVFSTYLYTGTGATRTITNNIDLSTKGGLVWIKNRDTNGYANLLIDTVRGAPNALVSNLTDPETSATYGLTAFTTSGFTLGTAVASDIEYNGSNKTFVSWTFREQPKFFDVVTWTGNGSNPRNISHSLGSVPGCIIIKCTSTGATDWFVYHRSLGNTQSLNLNQAVAAETGTAIWGSTTPTSTVFTVGNINANTNGRTYVAYLFAHDAGGFGLTGTDNVISCGSFVGTGSDLSVNLGYEPQWLLVKRASSGTENWAVYDNMRGMFVNYDDQILFPNTSGAEVQVSRIAPTATGFSVTSGYPASGTTYIYIAIRRGPMKVPTTGTSVFQPVTYSGNGSNDRLVNTTITPDLFIDMRRENIMPRYVLDRLRGNGRLYSDLSNAESANTAQVPANTFNVNQTGVTVSADEVNASGRTFVLEAFRRAPSFFDVVCYTGTGVARTVSHNLAAVPELMIVKQRSNTNNGAVYTASGGTGVYLRLFSTSSDSGNTPTTGDELWNSTTPTSSVFSVNGSARVNGNASTYVAYLFATCAGVSKVGSYTGTGATQTINCGFTGGARFVLIKKSTQTAPDRDWYVWDTARGMTSGTDPSLKLNTDTAEVNANDIYTITTGFQIVSSSDYVNASGVTYIFLAIA